MDPAEKQRRDHAVRQARVFMLEVAAEQEVITYQDLADKLTTKYAPNGSGFAGILSEASRKSYAERRILLSAVVVHVSDGLPGDGFFTLAEEFGFATEDRQACWGRAIAEVHQSYQP